MEKSELIEKIDQTLAEGVDGSRRTHRQIQEFMQYFRRQAEMEHQKNQQQNNQQSKTKGE